MANLNFTLKEEDWYESQPIQLYLLGNLLLASILEMQQTTELLCTKVLMERIMYLTKQHLGLESSVI